MGRFRSVILFGCISLLCFSASAESVSQETDPRQCSRQFSDTAVPVAELADPARIRAQLNDVIAAMPETLLLKDEELWVVLVPGPAMGPLMDEVGALRERAFREVGEGTQKARDIDQFDLHYDHLILWNPVRSEIEGSYRMTRVNRLVHSPEDLPFLYTHSFFGFDQRLLRLLSFFDAPRSRAYTALELGRSFIRPEYQSSSALQKAWRGIARYLLLHPEIQSLFGPASIGSLHSERARTLIADYVLTYHRSPLADRGLLALNEPYIPHQVVSRDELNEIKERLGTLSKFSRFVATQEGNVRLGVPPLLKSYLETLRGRVIAGNWDHQFGSLDLLIHVDLGRIPKNVILNFLGDEREAEQFLKARPRHGR